MTNFEKWTVRIVIFGAILLGTYLGAYAQTAAEEQSYRDSSVRAFREVRASRELITALKGEVAALETAEAARAAQADALGVANQALATANKAQADQIASQKLQISALAAIKCDQTSLFWGVVRKKRCR